MANLRLFIAVVNSTCFSISLLLSPNHLLMRYTVFKELLGGYFETYSFIERNGVCLSMKPNLICVEFLTCNIYRCLHDFTCQAKSSVLSCGNYSSNFHLLDFFIEIHPCVCSKAAFITVLDDTHHMNGIIVNAVYVVIREQFCSTTNMSSRSRRIS